MTALIIIVCILLIFSYVFDITSSKTKIPSVILLLLLGWTVAQISKFIGISIPDLSETLPILGTFGLILIVLEGTLELKLTKEKLPLVVKTTLIAILPMILLSLGLGYAFHFYGNTSFKNGITNAIPFSIISSAIAISSAQNLASENKEFITYESSLSDIFGVIFFNFIVFNDTIGFDSFGNFILKIIIILGITLISTIALVFLLSKIKHHVKFVPIIILIILIYEICKVYHLPGLIFILLFGIVLSNIEKLKKIKFIENLNPFVLKREVVRFKELTTEFVFLIRSLFFLLFGFLIETSEILNPKSIGWALAITGGILLLRFLFLKLLKIPLHPLFFISPRGLITILLFLSIPLSQKTDIANNSLMIQVIVLTALLMMLGLMTSKYKKSKELIEDH